MFITQINMFVLAEEISENPVINTENSHNINIPYENKIVNEDELDSLNDNDNKDNMVEKEVVTNPTLKNVVYVKKIQITSIHLFIYIFITFYYTILFDDIYQSIDNNDKNYLIVQLLKLQDTTSEAFFAKFIQLPQEMIMNFINTLENVLPQQCDALLVELLQREPAQSNHEFQKRLTEKQQQIQQKVLEKQKLDLEKQKALPKQKQQQQKILDDQKIKQKKEEEKYLKMKERNISYNQVRKTMKCFILLSIQLLFPLVYGFSNAADIYQSYFHCALLHSILLILIFIYNESIVLKMLLSLVAIGYFFTTRELLKFLGIDKFWNGVCKYWLFSWLFNGWLIYAIIFFLNIVATVLLTMHTITD